MLELKNLQKLADDLRFVFDHDIKQGKTFEQVKDTYIQIKELEQLIYERKVILKREGLYDENGTARDD